MIQTSAVNGGEWSYVLLRAANETEQVQEGEVTDQGEGYEIRLGEKSRMWLPRHRVLFVGPSMESLYVFKKNRIVNWSPGDHFQMSRWCIQHELLLQAAEHYAKVAERHKEHPSVRQLSVELKQQMLADEGFRNFIGLVPVATPTRIASDAVREDSESAVVSASADDSTSVSILAKQQFTSRIQPILRNRCSQAACHGYRSPTPLKLFEPYGQNASRTTSRNLEQLLQYTQIGPRGEMPALLDFATTAHGNQREPGIKLNDTALIAELQGWLHLLNGQVILAGSPPNLPGGVVNAGGFQQPVGANPSVQPAAGVQPPSPPNGAGLNLVPTGAADLRTVPLDPATVSPERLHTDNSQLMSEIDLLDQQLRQTLGETLRQLPTKPQPPAAGASTGILGLPKQSTSGSDDPFDAAAFNAKNHR